MRRAAPTRPRCSLRRSRRARDRPTTGRRRVGPPSRAGRCVAPCSAAHADRGVAGARRRHARIAGLVVGARRPVDDERPRPLEHDDRLDGRGKRRGPLFEQPAVAGRRRRGLLVLEPQHLARMRREDPRPGMRDKLTALDLRERPECVGVEDGGLRKIAPERERDRLCCRGSAEPRTDGPKSTSRPSMRQVCRPVRITCSSARSHASSSARSCTVNQSIGSEVCLKPRTVAASCTSCRCGSSSRLRRWRK